MIQTPQTADWQIWIQIFGLLSQIIQTLVVVVGVPFVISQIRNQTKAIEIDADSFKVSNYMEMMSLAAGNDEKMLQDEDLLDFYDQEKYPAHLGSSWDSLDAKRRRHFFYLARLINHYERAFVLWNRGWLENQDYRAILVGLAEIMQLRIFVLWWPSLRL